MDNNKDVDIQVKDVMSSPAITVKINDKINKIASLMRSENIGSVVVLDNNSKPIGIITERDIVARIVARNLMPDDVKAEDIMSKPLRRIEPDATITEAAKIMRSSGVRRLIVFDKTELVGVISSDDIAKITPELITMIVERSNIGILPLEQKVALTGQCEKCGNWFENLNEIEGEFLCEECSEGE